MATVEAMMGNLDGMRRRAPRMFVLSKRVKAAHKTATYSLVEEPRVRQVRNPETGVYEARKVMVKRRRGVEGALPLKAFACMSTDGRTWLSCKR